MPPTGLRTLIPAASPALCALLDPSRGALQPPIRSEIFGQQRFAQHGHSLGETHRAARARPRSPTFYPRLRSNIEVLREAHAYIGVQAATGYDVSPAAEWLLDNFHLIEAQLTQIREGLPRRYFRELPMLVEESLAGLPRVYGVAWGFVAHTDGDFDEVLLAAYLGAYQETCELKLSELWALPTTLRVVLIENLRRLAERVACNKAAREAANICCDQLGNLSVAALEQGLADLDRRGVGRMFLAQMALRLQDRRPGVDLGIRAEHHAWLQRSLPDLATVQAQHSADQAADNLSVSNAVNSLRDIGDADWPRIVSRTSRLMKLMLSSPVFEAEHATTRDQTLHGIDRLSRRSGLGELLVAEHLLGLMNSAPPGQPLADVPLYWLLGAGRPMLLHALGWQEPGARAWRLVASRLTLPGYLTALLLGSAAVLTWLLLRQGMAWGRDWLPVALVMAFPASEAVIAVVNRLISESARPRQLPRLAFSGGIPAEHRVLVVIPAMLGDAAAVDSLLHRLELHHLANPEHMAQFALLTDWLDADGARRVDDEPLLARARAGVEALSARHRGDPGADGDVSRLASPGRSSTAARLPGSPPARDTWSRSMATHSCRRDGCATWSASPLTRRTGPDSTAGNGAS
jgi:cyclic beta-1,2-glucan synthetase